MVIEDDELAIDAAIQTWTSMDRKRARVVCIKNTPALEEIFVSEAMVEDVSRTEGVKILAGPRPFRFDDEGNPLDLA